MKFKILIYSMGFVFINSCTNSHPHYIITDIDMKLANTDSLFHIEYYRVGHDTNNCVVIVYLTLAYPDGGNVLFNDLPGGQEGILYKIKKIDFTGGITDSSIKGFTFSPDQFAFDSPHIKYHKFYSSNLNTYNDIGNMQLSINNRERKSVGLGIHDGILLSAPCDIKEKPFIFRMYFENGDSLIKQFNLKDSSVLELKNAKSN